MEQHPWFQIGKGVHQGCILSPCLFNLCAEYIMRNPGLEEAQVGIKIARRNINHLSYADDSTLMAESEEQLKSLLIKVKEESEKSGLKQHSKKKKKDHGIWSHHFMINRWGNNGNRFYLGGSKITASGDFVFQCFLVFEKQIPLDGDSTDVSTI